MRAFCTGAVVLFLLRACCIAEVVGPPNELQRKIRAAKAKTTDGNYREARSDFDQLLRSDMLATHANASQKAEVYIGLATTLVNMDQFPAAVNLFELALRLNFSDIVQENVLKGAAIAGYTVALTKLGRFKQATRAAQQVL